MRKTQSACLNAVCIKTNINSPSTAPTNPLTNTPSTALHSIRFDSLAFRWRNIGMGIIRFRFQFIVWWLFRSASKRFAMNICTRVTSHIFMCCSPSSPELATKKRFSFVVCQLECNYGGSRLRWFRRVRIDSFTRLIWIQSRAHKGIANWPQQQRVIPSHSDCVTSNFLQRSTQLVFCYRNRRL